MPFKNEIAKYLGLGAEITGSLVIPILLGFWIDNYFDISPFGILIGATLGMILFFVMILKISKEGANKN